MRLACGCWKHLASLGARVSLEVSLACKCSFMCDMSASQCKKGWPRCPSCKTKLSLLTAGAAPLEGEEVGKSISSYSILLRQSKHQLPSHWFMTDLVKQRRRAAESVLTCAVSLTRSRACAQTLVPRPSTTQPPAGNAKHRCDLPGLAAPAARRRISRLELVS